MPQTIVLKRSTTLANVPTTLTNGELAANLVTDPIKMWIGTPAGVKELQFGGKAVTVSPTPPVNPVADMLWWDSTHGALYIRFGNNWVAASPAGQVQAAVIVAASPPQNVPDDVLWFDSTDGRLFFKYTDIDSSQWVEIQGPTGAAGAAGAPGPMGPPWASTGTAPLMLAATNGAVSLTGSPPALSRIGNTVFLQYQGANKTTVTANTISIAEIPPGFQPTANVAQAIQTPAITMNIQRYTGATTVFPDTPGANQAAGGLRWSLRHGTQFAANAAVSISMQWQTNDP